MAREKKTTHDLMVGWKLGKILLLLLLYLLAIRCFSIARAAPNTNKWNERMKVENKILYMRVNCILWFASGWEVTILYLDSLTIYIVHILESWTRIIMCKKKEDKKTASYNNERKTNTDRENKGNDTNTLTEREREKEWNWSLNTETL